MALFAAANYDAVRSMVEPFAEAGVADAQCMMGLLFQIGAGTEVSGELAVYWYQKAASQDHAIALNNLGTIYLSGMPGIDADRNLALKYYSRSRMFGFNGMDVRELE